MAISLTDEEAIRGMMEQVQPEAVIHTAAISDANRCATDPEGSFAVNVSATRLLAKHCSRLGARMVFCSSDLVFRGDNAPYDEAATPNPVSTYGSHKQLAESAVLEAGDHIVARLPLMYGDNGPVSRNMLSAMVHAARDSRTITLFTDEFRTPAYGGDVADGLYQLLHAPAGIYHLGGPERLSRYDIGLQVARSFGFDEALLQPFRQADIPMAAARPPDVSLNSAKASQFGFAPRTMAAVLARLATQYASGQVVL